MQRKKYQSINRKIIPEQKKRYVKEQKKDWLGCKVIYQAIEKKKGRKLKQYVTENHYFLGDKERDRNLMREQGSCDLGKE